MPKVTTTGDVLRAELAPAAGNGVDTIPEDGCVEQEFGIDGWPWPGR
ncbi:hypothetical protein ACFWBF_11600 [Streptomyces sp. NPDC060028]